MLFSLDLAAFLIKAKCMHVVVVFLRYPVARGAVLPSRKSASRAFSCLFAFIYSFLVDELILLSFPDTVRFCLT